MTHILNPLIIKRLLISMVGIATTVTYPGTSTAQYDTHPDTPLIQSNSICDLSAVDFADVLHCYKQTLDSQPLTYVSTGHSKTDGVELRSYQLTSQSWPIQSLAQPTNWRHDVTLYIPENVLPERALLIVNNGIRHGIADKPSAPSSDFTTETLITLARDTRTAIVSISDVPNQYLTFTADHKPRREDDLVAHSWTLFLDDPQNHKALPLHVPMAAAASQAMRLAERALADLNIHRFIISGISKRAWASWLTTIADPRVDAILPFAIDLLDVRQGLENIYRSYGKNWPIAFGPYVAEEVDARLDSPEFSAMMQIEDPLQYLSTPYKTRMNVPKYIVNASGDDFFVPDNSRLYYDRLPGAKALRMVPNASHAGIGQAVAQSLTGFVNRIQAGKPLAHVEATLRSEKDTKNVLQVKMSEAPRTLQLWHSTNTVARDFRYACGIRYTPTPIGFSGTDTVEITLEEPPGGWSAYFVEATFEDGFVATSPTYILGKVEYPDKPPPNIGPSCTTIPGSIRRQPAVLYP
jgi:PhoPQ-activated pathogenicity-related protein